MVERIEFLELSFERYKTQSEQDIKILDDQIGVLARLVERLTEQIQNLQIFTGFEESLR